jgi:hypothetical protein
MEETTETTFEELRQEDLQTAAGGSVATNIGAGVGAVAGGGAMATAVAVNRKKSTPQKNAVLGVLGTGTGAGVGAMAGGFAAKKLGKIAKVKRVR